MGKLRGRGRRITPSGLLGSFNKLFVFKPQGLPLGLDYCDRFLVRRANLGYSSLSEDMRYTS